MVWTYPVGERDRCYRWNYQERGPQEALSAFTLVLYLLIVCANLLLMVVNCMSRSLREHVYMLACSLFVN